MPILYLQFLQKLEQIVDCTNYLLTPKSDQNKKAEVPFTAVLRSPLEVTVANPLPKAQYVQTKQNKAEDGT